MSRYSGRGFIYKNSKELEKVNYDLKERQDSERWLKSLEGTIVPTEDFESTPANYLGDKLTLHLENDQKIDFFWSELPTGTIQSTGGFYE